MLSLNSLRRNWARSVFVLLAAVFLSSVLLFTGCPAEGGGNAGGFDSDLIGTWEDPQNNDGYTITAANVNYYDWTGVIVYGGAIRDARAFTDNAGVIIIEYDADKKNSYFHDAHWGTEAAGWADACVASQPCAHYIPPTGDFVGIYYEDLTPGVSVKMGQAINLGTYTGAETTTLGDAIRNFTSGKKGDFISYMGVYVRQYP